ncbi:metallophosphoesterase family protein [Flagellimonas onchidii]|uniref:metallophosphoesterase family protein n=1 Tax=Flagellimonas onchidii TaxID=2562684 RepID=UPI0010A665E2|nr:metallophosphoesterase family protein [Allomuricauda onchidii]
MKNRRDFVKILSIGGLAAALPTSLSAQNLTKNKRKSLNFGICADIHKDIMHDADSRLKAFVDEAKEKNLDFIIQLGDFCRPYDHNLDFMSIWNSYPGKKYHVIGNHDMDGGFTREQVVEYWNSEGKYYSFDCNGYHFIVLDGNDKDPSPNRPKGYARYIGKEQLEWLEKDLAETQLPTIVFCHQGLDNDLGGIYNGTESRLVLEQANEQAGFQKVQFVFSGHHHQNYHNNINGIHYIQINSMSYQWLGDDFKHIRYSEAVDKSHPWIKYTVPYKDPIWAYAEISTDNTFRLFGKKTEFVGPSPKDLGVDMSKYGYPIVPYISDRKIEI